MGLSFPAQLGPSEVTTTSTSSDSLGWERKAVVTWVGWLYPVLGSAVLWAGHNSSESHAWAEASTRDLVKRWILV